MVCSATPDGPPQPTGVTGLCATLLPALAAVANASPDCNILQLVLSYADIWAHFAAFTRNPSFQYSSDCEATVLGAAFFFDQAATGIAFDFAQIPKIQIRISTDGSTFAVCQEGQVVGGVDFLVGNWPKLAANAVTVGNIICQVGGIPPEDFTPFVECCSKQETTIQNFLNSIK